MTPFLISLSTTSVTLPVTSSGGAGQVPFKLPSSDGVTTVGDSGMMAAVRQWMNRLSF